MRVCTECGRSFKPSSGHPECPACRSKDLCGCGRVKQKHSRGCEECCRRDGELNGNWKGGRARHHAGYVMIRVPDHPRVAGSRAPYVFEHILVMEEMLGRHLESDETVHHRNGVRDDNRPQNLELWVRPQPSGIRVEDAIAWAWDILERYEGVGHLQQRSDELA